MPTIMPEGEKLRKAVQWISEMRSENTKRSNQQLLQEACLKFNLSPLESDYLMQFVKQAPDEQIKA